MAYANNVFINCPFDGKYKDMFHAIVFTIYDCGFIARCALENRDSHHVRIDKLFQLIEECPYGIHDLSRAGIDPKIKLARFNMPLELGIFMGCKKYGNAKNKQKCYLVLDIDRYRYRNFISDISGQDISAHNKEIRRAIVHTRDWLNEKTREQLSSGSVMFDRYNSFKRDLPKMCKKNGWLAKELTFVDYTGAISAWLSTKT